jgi:acyl carrier protein
MKSTAHLVHAAVAMHVGLDAHAIEPSQRLSHDLGLDAFDLVLVALRLEELEPSRGEFPMEELVSIRTVRDLTALHEAWLSPERKSVA